MVWCVLLVECGYGKLRALCLVGVVFVSAEWAGKKGPLLWFDWWGWAFDLQAQRMVWLWTSYTRALMPGRSLGPWQGVGIVSREPRLPRSVRRIVPASSEREAMAMGKQGKQSSSLPLCYWGFLARPFSSKLCSSGDTLMRCIMQPVPIQPDAG